VINLESIIVITLAVGCVAAAGVWFLIDRRARQRKAELERHSITPEQLSQALAGEPRLPIFDLREPLDILSNSEVIPGAWRICPHRVLENPWLLPRSKAAVIYCTSPSDETSHLILERALSMGFLKIKLLKGGLRAWKAKGFAVEPYFKRIGLDAAT
jgi:rhodanese-related sulfurtransferase